jgi:hypothetical protein
MATTCSIRREPFPIPDETFPLDDLPSFSSIFYQAVPQLLHHHSLQGALEWHGVHSVFQDIVESASEAFFSIWTARSLLLRSSQNQASKNSERVLLARSLLCRDAPG